MRGAEHKPSVATSPIFARLALQNLGRRPARTCLLALTVALGSGALFATATVVRGTDASLEVGLARMGADLMVVPRDTLVNLTRALLAAEPTPYLLDAAVADEVARLPGVRRVALQRVFHVPASSSSCNHEIELFAFDPARDFTVTPWIVERLERPMQPDDVLIGSRRDYALGSEITLNGRPLTVYGRLGQTDVGVVDLGFFTTFATAAGVTHENEGQASALLVQLDVGVASEEVRFAIARLPGVKVVAGGSAFTSIRQGLTALLSGVVGLAILMLVSMALMIGVLFSAIVAERHHELGLLRALGARRRQVARLILLEAALTTGLGGLAGLALGVVLLLAFRRSLVYYFETIQVPFLWPTLGSTALVAAGCVALAAGLGVSGAFLPAWRASRRDPFDLIRSEAK